MEDPRHEKTEPDRDHWRIRKSVALGSAAGVILIVLLSVYGSGIFGPEANLESVLGAIEKENEMVSRMRTNLLKSVELEKSAVMAITDEESKNYADLSRKAADKVNRDFRELKALIDKEGGEKEMQLLGEFDVCWRNFRKIDEELLALSVENTNLKAADLSYTKGLETIKRFSAALLNLMDASPSNPREVQITKRAYHALNAAFMIYSLQGPHINEAEDRKMDELEAAMKRHAARAEESLAALSALADKQGKPYLSEAQGAFRDFMALHAEVIRLSRLNSNVKSLQLSLGNKRKVTAQCEDSLNSLQETIRNKTFKATR